MTFTPGMHVLVISGGSYDRKLSRATIDKIYKTGKITLIGSRQQYAPNSAGNQAFQTGASTWSYPSLIEPMTLENAGRLAQYKQEQKRLALWSRIRDHLDKSRDTPADQLDAVAAILGVK